ncbi:MAG: FumA C-terminus/TtdB family hydratase beta subunit [bacterium]
MIDIQLPMPEEQARSLRTGDDVRLHGRMVTARDVAHKFMVEKRPTWLRPILEGSVIYHCGPVVQRRGSEYVFTAAGPTTSIREEPYQGKVIADYGVRGVVGKGGMGAATQQALVDHGAVYLHAIGGAAALLARCVKRVESVYMLEEFGVPEAFWVIQVESFPAVVTMDSTGDSLHERVLAASKKKVAGLFPG